MRVSSSVATSPRRGILPLRRPARAKERAAVSLADRIAVVTGGGKGIGKAIALALAQAGADVAVVDIDAKAAQATAGDVSAKGRRSAALGADIGDLGSIDRMTRAVMETFGRIDVLVNNAGVTRRAYIMDLTEAD